MKILTALLAWMIASQGLCQTQKACDEALSDAHFRPPMEMTIGQPAGFAPRIVRLLLSQNGMDIYGLSRAAYPTGEPVRDGSIWIIGVFTDEAVREAEAQNLMRRLQNPHLNSDYAAGLKYVIVRLEFEDDKDKLKKIGRAHV